MPGTQPSFVVPGAQRYLDALAAHESPTMRRVRERCEAEGLPAVSPLSGQVLRTLAAAAGAGRILEVGALHGYSGLWLLASGPEARLETVEIDPANAEVAAATFREAGVGDRARILLGDALEVLPALEGPYDLVFLDGVKADYPAYLEHALRLLRDGGVLAADNALWSGRVWDAAANDPDTAGLRRYTAEAFGRPDLVSTLLPVGDGLAVSVLRRASR